MDSIKSFDDIGLYTDELRDEDIRYDGRKMIEYAISIGKTATDLSDEEREQFRIR